MKNDALSQEVLVITERYSYDEYSNEGKFIDIRTFKQTFDCIKSVGGYDLKYELCGANLG